MVEEPGKTTNASFLKRVLMCTISISIFAILVCRSSWHAESLFPHSFNICFSTALFSAFSRTFERKFVFLVCNRILAILARTSPNLAGSSPPSVAIKGEAAVDGNVVPRDSTALAYGEDGVEQLEEEEPDLQGIQASRAGTKEDEIETEWVIADDGDVNMEEDGLEEEEGEEESASNRDVTEETAAAVTEDVSTEELNWKIEEFIRKMEEEIQIEAQRVDCCVVR